VFSGSAKDTSPTATDSGPAFRHSQAHFSAHRLWQCIARVATKRDSWYRGDLRVSNADPIRTGCKTSMLTSQGSVHCGQGDMRCIVRHQASWSGRGRAARAHLYSVVEAGHTILRPFVFQFRGGSSEVVLGPAPARPQSICAGNHTQPLLPAHPNPDSGQPRGCLAGCWLHA
jgi:hypothetical protein